MQQHAPAAFIAAAILFISVLVAGLSDGSIDAPRTATSGTALIGGPFEMVDHTGRTVTHESYAGRFMLVYFGFTYCPDICPAELQVMAAAVEELGDAADHVQPLFVSIDPERDSVQQMAEYVPNFSERLVGLTGSMAQVQAMADAYKIYFAKTVDESSSAGYSMDHTSIVYLMGPDGEYVTHFTMSAKPAEMASKIQGYL
jgi:protein SCO1/2